MKNQEIQNNANYVKLPFGIMVIKELCPMILNNAKFSQFGIENINLATLFFSQLRLTGLTGLTGLTSLTSLTGLSGLSGLSGLTGPHQLLHLSHFPCY